MSSTAQWLHRIAGARSEHELVSTVREYVMSFPAADLERIPPHCRVALVSTGQEISFAAVTLVQCELKGGMDAATAQTVRLMADVFVAAQNRLRKMASAREPVPKTAE
jgi:hypothetical protein